MIGIYKITNKITRQTYIGCSVDILRRWKDHIKSFNRKKNCNKKLCLAVEEYGITNFTFEIVEIIDDINDIFKIEQKYIDSLNLESDYNAINSFGKNKKHRKKELDKFIEWIENNWIATKSDKTEKECRLYKKEDKEEFVKLALKYNILDLYMNKITFNRIMGFLEEIGYIVKDGKTRINSKHTRYKIILDKPTPSML